MTHPFEPTHPRSARHFVLLLVALTFAAGCGGRKPLLPEGTVEADKYLFTRGNEEIADKNWTDARAYYRRLVDGYPQSPHRPDAKLGVADSYLGENNVESFVLAVNEYREFLSFYPTHTRADYAQYKIAMSHFGKMRSPDRDQTETREALVEFEVFFERYSTSALTPEVRISYREAKDRLSHASVNVGLFYFKSRRWYPGAIARFREVLADDPGFTARDSVYYYLAESLLLSKKNAEAVPYLDRLLNEFPDSEWAPEAKRRLDAELTH
jgi:outer membrane protein assembly factor BamD